MVSDQGQYLATSTTVPFSVETGSTLRLQQLLAELGYLPLTFTPTAPMTSLTQEADVQQGTFGWRWAEPAGTWLTSLWTPGEMNVITKGAIMDFQDQHDLKTDGAPGPAVWTDLLADAASGHADANPYRNVYVSEGQPRDRDRVLGRDAASTTRWPTPESRGAPTQQGTFPVYARYLTTTMTGTNPDGTTYSDPGIPWVSYFNGGDALHGYVRGSYGFPQSNGCVEMPPADAAIVYPLTPIGTLVTVGLARPATVRGPSTAPTSRAGRVRTSNVDTGPTALRPKRVLIAATAWATSSHEAWAAEPGSSESVGPGSNEKVSCLVVSRGASAETLTPRRRTPATRSTASSNASATAAMAAPASTPMSSVWDLVRVVKSPKRTLSVTVRPDNCSRDSASATESDIATTLARSTAGSVMSVGKVCS